MENGMPKQRYDELLARKLIAEFERSGIEGHYCESKEDALQHVLRLLPEGCIVSRGGSATLHEIGLPEALKSGGYQYLDPGSRGDGQSAAEKDAIAHQALAADYYLMGCNAIAETGELVNADGYGNRIASLIFGPKNVIVIAGMNKVEPTLEAAIARATRYAASLVLLDFKPDYASMDDLVHAAEAIRGHLLVTRMSTTKGRIKVVLVGESLGY
jgi:L-lactate utilization protein LutB